MSQAAKLLCLPQPCPLHVLWRPGAPRPHLHGRWDRRLTPAATLTSVRQSMLSLLHGAPTTVNAILPEPNTIATHQPSKPDS